MPDNPSYISLIETSAYSKATGLLRKLQEEGYACKIEQVENPGKNRRYEVHVLEKDLTRAQLAMFGETYEPDHDGSYAQRALSRKMLIKKLRPGTVFLLTGLLLVFVGDSKNSDLFVLAIVALGIGFWFFIGAFKLMQAQVSKQTKGKKNQPYE